MSCHLFDEVEPSFFKNLLQKAPPPDHPGLTPHAIEARDRLTVAMALQIAQRGVSPTLEMRQWDMAYGRYTWDVTTARTVIAHTPHLTIPLPTDYLAWIAAHATIDTTYARTTDPTQPGIMAPHMDLERDVWQHILIDGNHRAYQAHMTQQPFTAYVLSPLESWLLMLEHPVAWESIYYAAHLSCGPDCVQQTLEPMGSLVGGGA